PLRRGEGEQAAQPPLQRGGVPQVGLVSPTPGHDGAPVSLAALLPTLQRAPAFAELQRSVAGARPGSDPVRLSVADPAKPYAIAALHAELGRCVVLLTARPGNAR